MRELAVGVSRVSKKVEAGYVCVRGCARVVALVFCFFPGPSFQEKKSRKPKVKKPIYAKTEEARVWVHFHSPGAVRRDSTPWSARRHIAPYTYTTPSILFFDSFLSYRPSVVRPFFSSCPPPRPSYIRFAPPCVKSAALLLCVLLSRH